MKFRSALALALLVAAPGLASSLARADQQPTAAGFWEYQDSDGNPVAWFQFKDKDGVYAARLVKGFKKKGDDTPPQLVCTQCPGKKKGAHIMGLTLFWGMKRDGLTYSDGSVLDPRDGSIYHAQMTLSEDGKELAVRGYLGISILGHTDTWHRLPDDAMKKEDIPKEILANGEDASGDKADKPRHASTEKAKHKAKTAAKASKSESAETDSATPAAAPDPAPTKDAQ